MREAQRFQLPSGRVVALVALTVLEQLVAKRAGGTGTGYETSSAVTMAGLRISLREIDGAAVRFDQLGGLESRFKVRDLTAMQAAFQSLHIPAQPLAYTLTAGDALDSYEVTLEGGEKVTLRELAHPAFSRCMAQLESERGCPAAAEFVVGLAGLRASIAGIPSDNALWPYSARDTSGLVALWGQIHGGTFTMVPAAV